MRVEVPCSSEQEELIGDHLLLGKELYVASEERSRLAKLVKQKWPNSRIVGAEIDLENIKWLLDLEEVTVTN